MALGYILWIHLQVQGIAASFNINHRLTYCELLGQSLTNFSRMLRLIEYGGVIQCYPVCV